LISPGKYEKGRFQVSGVRCQVSGVSEEAAPLNSLITLFDVFRAERLQLARKFQTTSTKLFTLLNHSFIGVIVFVIKIRLPTYAANSHKTI